MYEEDFLHEMFVSFYFTNKLRRMVPNFQLCYGGLKVASATFSSDKQSNTNRKESDANIINRKDSDDETLDDAVIERLKERRLKEEIPQCKPFRCACDSTQTVDYLVLENIDGVPLTQALKTCSLEDALTWLCQITLALELGVTHFGFTHYNLHPDNVVIHKVENHNKSIDLIYWHRNQLLRLETSSRAVMRNFEMSHVKHMFVDLPDDDFVVVNKSEHFGVLAMNIWEFSSMKLDRSTISINFSSGC